MKTLQLYFFSILFLSSLSHAFGENVVPLPLISKPNGTVFILPQQVDSDAIVNKDDFTSLNLFYTGIYKQNIKFDSKCSRLGFFSQDLGEQGYELWIDDKEIVLAANSEQGIFYGKQTLKQLIAGAEKRILEGVHIIDKPAFKYRGLMYDISRGPVPTTDYMKYQIRRIAALKMNMLCYYNEHIVRTKKHPEFSPPDGGISIEEWKELAEYARRYYVELVPNFQSLGHAEEVLANPKYSHLGESSTMYSPVKQETVQFMRDIYDEMCPAFYSGFFHVNCDETFDLGRGASKELADSIGIAGVYAGYVNQLADILRQNNKRMMLWGDIALAHPEIIDMLPSDAVVMSWEYGDQKSFSEWIEPFAQKGMDYFVCPGVLNSLRLFPDYEQALPNIRNFIREGADKGAMGVLNTIWNNGGLHSFERDWYGVAYSAEHSWNPNDNSVSDFDKRLSGGVYAGEGEPLFSAIHHLTEMTKIHALGDMKQDVFWKVLIPDRGEYINVDISGWDEVLQACLQTDSILEQHKSSGFLSEYESVRYVSDEYKYLATAKLGMANAAKYYNEACIVQNTNRDEAARLLKDARKNIVTCQQQFSGLKDKFFEMWQAENRNYWSYYPMDLYNRVQRSYEELLFSFDRSVSFFEKQLPLNSPADVCLGIRESTGTYLTFWLISPPFKSKGGNNLEHDFLKGMGGEQNASPFPGFSFTDESGRNVKWMKYASSYPSKVLLNDAVDAGDGDVVYAFCTIQSSGDKMVNIYLGAQKSIEVFCNGQSVLQQKNNSRLVIDQFKVPLQLKAGKNRILLKIEKGDDNWGFSLGIKDLLVTGSKNKYRIN